MSDSEWVTIRHPNHGDDAATSRVRRKAYNRVWAGKGFEIVDPVTVHASTILGKPVKSLDDLNKPELITLASRSGVELTGKESEKQLLKAAKEAIQGGQETEDAELDAAAGEEQANG